MARYTILLIILGITCGTVPVFGQQPSPPDNGCIACHAREAGRLQQPAVLFEHDIHGKKGVLCQDCHGGNAGTMDKRAAKSAAAGYRGNPTRGETPQFCARCHSDENYMKKFNPNIRVDQLDRYYTSVHGQRLQQGDQKVAMCTDCHLVHEIRASTDVRSATFPTRVADTCGRCHADADYMQEYGIPTTQVEHYRTSIHAAYLYDRGDMTAPTCNDCHGNHGAVPPGVQSIQHVCGTCHVSNERLFHESSHGAYFEALEMPGCITCHDNHATTRVLEDALALDQDEERFCDQCHDAGAGGGVDVARIQDVLDSLVTALHRNDSLIQLVEAKGMDISEARFQFSQAGTALTATRNLVHSFSPETIQQSAAEGFTLLTTIEQTTADALEEIKTRRIGLSLALVFILLLCGGLYIKIREYGIPPMN